MRLKNLVAILLSALLVLSPAVDAFAVKEETLNAISQNCASIKLQLERTQKEDSRTRVYLGAQYETISSGLMQTLNIRLVRNNMSSPNLAEQQISFASELSKFKDDFTAYSQDLEKLVKIDCKAQPEEFYKKLNKVRKGREEVNESTKRLREIISAHRGAVEQYSEELTDGED